jgi:transmembrane sensor
MDELARQMEQARAHLVVHWSDERAAEAARGLGRLRRRRAVRRAVAAGAGVAALVLLLAAGVSWKKPPVVASPHDTSDRTLRFADGSSANPISAETVLRTTSAKGRVAVRIDRGSARFVVVHDPARTFLVEVGAVRVEDLGTRFVVERVGLRAHVAVEEGCVVVTWPAGRQEIVSGQSGWFPPERQALEAAPEPAQKTTPPHRAQRVQEDKTWKALAEEGDFDQAYQRMRLREIPDVAEDLLSAADVARLSHHPADAVLPLRQILHEHARDPRAPLAAFTLGRILLEELGNPRESAVAFAAAQTLAPDGPLVSDALAREVESLSRAGDADRARSRAKDYLRRFPSGSRVRSVRRYGGLD